MENIAMEEQLEEVIHILSTQSVNRLLYGLLVLLGGLVVTRVLLRVLDRITQQLRLSSPTIHRLLHRALKWVLYAITVIVAAGTIGIPINSFVAVLSVIGLALSLAVQGVLTNLAGGIILFTSKPFAPGDFVEADEVCGTVQEIGFLYTRMEAPDGRLIVLPNSLMHASRLINYNAIGRRRIDLTVSASYDNTPEEVRAAAMDAIATVSRRQAEAGHAGCVLEEPAPQVLLEGYGESSIAYTVRLWVTAVAFVEVRYALNEELYGAFRRGGVAMTYPHLMVHTVPPEP